METNDKLETGRKILGLLNEHYIRLRYMSDDPSYLEYHIEEGESEADSVELSNFFGTMKTVKSDEEKDGGECIETTVVHFENYDLYIKEISVGECNYKDVAIDGESDSSYILVEPVEVKRIEYVEIK